MHESFFAGCGALVGIGLLMFSTLQLRAGELACCAETELTYANVDVGLAAVLLRPTEGEEFPAAVLLQGSGTSDRTNGWARLIAETLAAKGVVDVRGIPAFISYGELDESDNVPVRASVKWLEDQLEGASLTVKVYPGTGHSLMDELLMRDHHYELVDGLLVDLDVWIETNLSTAPQENE